VRLTQSDEYSRRGLGPEAIARLELFGDLLLDTGVNVTSIDDPVAIEQFHFLDSLALLELDVVRAGRRLVDIGSGAGLPALVLALALPSSAVTAVESQRKKCAFIERAADALGLDNVEVRCERAEDYGRKAGREAHDVAVSRALAALAVVAEYSLPLLKQKGTMIAMKGAISDQERIQAESALSILGGGELRAVRLEPFAGAENRWVYLTRRERPTPPQFPRRPGMPERRPLGG
jgi:16S rRNA (guanine527-N7)-methyltransferase